MSEGFININGDHVQTLEILFLTTVIALLPSLLVMMTFFHQICHLLLLFAFGNWDAADTA